MGLFRKLFGDPGVNKIKLIKELAKLNLCRNPMMAASWGLDKNLVDTLDDLTIMATAEATIVSIVETYSLLRKQGISEQDALQLIETHRSQPVMGKSGGMPSPLNLCNYVKYRLYLEYEILPMGNRFIEEAVELCKQRYGMTLDEKEIASQKVEDVHESTTVTWENLFKDIEKANSAASDTCWHQLTQIICYPAEGQEYWRVVKSFLIPNSISSAKFRVNALELCGWLSYLHVFKVTFDTDPSASVAKLSSVKDIKPLGSKAYPYWFLAAYPDVVMWAANIFTFDFTLSDLCVFTTDDNVFRDIFGDIGRENELADGCFIKHKHLRALIEAYRKKTGHTLECST